MNQFTKSFQSNSGLIFLIALFVAIGFRLYLNFSNELLSGNGGYYPLQVRTLLERGELGFADMPFLFYLDAGVVKLLGLLGLSFSDQLLLDTVKFLDACVFPLVVFPFYYIKKWLAPEATGIFTIAILLYLLVSFVPMSLLSSFQKNAFAIVLLVSSWSFWIQYNKTYRRHFLIWALVFSPLSLSLTLEPLCFH